MNTTTESISLIDQFDAYVKALKGHDWYYDYSDDGAVYRAGLAKSMELQAVMKTMPQLAPAYWAFTVYNHSQGDHKHNKESLEAKLKAIRDDLAIQATTNLITPTENTEA
jgi:hypothetical protein